jgi:hypothetical protein
MGFLDNTSITVDAILTKKGRELLARGKNEFKITKFALSDDEIDYTLWDVTHPNGTNYYGEVIENMPLLEASPDENQIMRYKLTTLPKNTTKLPILELPAPSFTFNGAGITQTVSPNTRNGSDAALGYTFTLHNSDACRMTLATGGGIPGGTPTTPVFMTDEERKLSVVLVGQSVNIISRTVVSAMTTQLTITGNQTGTTYTVLLVVNPPASTSSTTAE